MTKAIKIENCQTCPHEGKCKAWTSLSKSQRVQLAIGNNTPHEFILAKCHLDDELKSELSEYLLSDDYINLLERAILSRYGTSSNNKVKHHRVINMIEKFKLDNKEGK